MPTAGSAHVDPGVWREGSHAPLKRCVQTRETQGEAKQEDLHVDGDSLLMDLSDTDEGLEAN